MKVSHFTSTYRKIEQIIETNLKRKKKILNDRYYCVMLVCFLWIKCEFCKNFTLVSFPKNSPTDHCGHKLRSILSINLKIIIYTSNYIINR